MRKIWLIAFFFYTTVFSLSGDENFFDFKMNLNTSISFPFESQKQFLQGISVSNPIFDFKAFYSDNNFIFGNTINYGNLIPNIPIKLSFGNLDTKGSISKLNSPALSSIISPFNSIPADVTSIDTTLPLSTSFSKPLSLAAEYSFVNKKYILQKAKINFLYNPGIQENNDNLVFSTEAKLKPSKSFELSGSITSGVFTLGEDNFQTWYSDIPHYPKTPNMISNLQTKISCNSKKNLRNKINFINSVSIFQQPQNSIYFTLEEHLQCQANHFSFNLSSFYNGHSDLITPQKKVPAQFQLKSGIKYSFLAGIFEPALCSIGFGTYEQFNLEEKSITLKQSLGIKTTAEKTIFSLQLNSTQIFDNNSFLLDNISLNFKSNYYIKDLKPVINFSFTASQNTHRIWSQKEKISCSVYFPHLINTNAAFSLTTEQTDWLYKSGNIDLSLSSKFYLKKISCTCKLSAAFDF